MRVSVRLVYSNSDTSIGTFVYGMYFYGINLNEIYFYDTLKKWLFYDMYTYSYIPYLDTQLTQVASQILSQHYRDKIYYQFFKYVF